MSDHEAERIAAEKIYGGPAVMYLIGNDINDRLVQIDNDAGMPVQMLQLPSSFDPDGITQGITGSPITEAAPKASQNWDGAKIIWRGPTYKFRLRTEPPIHANLLRVQEEGRYKGLGFCDSEAE